jgi:hypothetical protein
MITLLAEEPSMTGPDFGKASPIGLLVVVLLLLGVFALMWSMNRHLKKIPQSFDTPETDQPFDKSEVRSQAESTVGKPEDGHTGEPPREPSG